MEAPDKIYLCADAPRFYDWSNILFEKGGNVEYIRKDALLKWLEEQKELMEHGGHISIDDIIDKLNQM